MLHRFGLRPRRALSQHFLVDPRLARRIVESLAPAAADRVVEIGAGLGALTLPLAQRAGEVIAIERDARIAGALRWVLDQQGAGSLPPGRVRILVGDVLRLAMESFLVPAAPGRALILGNLPYGVTSQVLLLVATTPGWERAVVMVQREVAERLTAAPGGEAYGSLTVAVRSRCRVRRLFDVSPRAFFPPPDVESTVVEMAPLPGRPGGAQARALEAVLRAAFGQRRKTLRNALRALGAGPEAGRGGGLAAEQVEALLAAAGIDGSLRAEALDVEQFLRLAAAWCRLVPPGERR